MKTALLITILFLCSACASMAPVEPELPKPNKAEAVECQVTNNYYNKFEINFLNNFLNDLLDGRFF